MSKEQTFEPVQLSVSRDYLPDDLRLQIDLRFQVNENSTAEKQTAASAAPTGAELCRLASGIYCARRSRDKMLHEELFGEPAWDMMLALYCLPAKGEQLSVTGLSYAANVRQTTGLRVQAALARRGLIERRQEENDARRFLVHLTETGRAMLENYLVSLLRNPATEPCLQLGHS